MRLGVVLEPSPSAESLASLTHQARTCEFLGIELAWLGPAGDVAPDHSALSRAAAVASVTGALRLAASVAVGPHPLRIAEEATVADNCANGRLVLVLAASGQGEPELLTETADVLLAASAARPFRHQGVNWQIPANRPENDYTERRIRVTPAPAQLELPIWLTGDGAPAAARERGLCHVSAPGDVRANVADEWTATEAHLGRAAARLRRPAIRPVQTSPAGDFDAAGLAAELLADRAAWGMDVAVLRLPRSLDEAGRERALNRLARLVRPRVQLDALPAGLEEYWNETVVERDGEEIAT